jgi:N-acetylated-alpha-linked acidic dipeptidase
MDSIMYSETEGDPRYAIHETAAQWWGLLTMRLAELEILPFDYSTYALVMKEQLAGYEAQLNTTEVDFSALHTAISTFADHADRFQSSLRAFSASSQSAASLEYWNDKLVQLERLFLSDVGLPHRSWYKHVVFGPGFYEGYKAAAFPGIADAIVFKDPADALQSHVDEVARVVSRAAAFITQD